MCGTYSGKRSGLQSIMLAVITVREQSGSCGGTSRSSELSQTSGSKQSEEAGCYRNNGRSRDNARCILATVMLRLATQMRQQNFSLSSHHSVILRKDICSFISQYFFSKFELPYDNGFLSFFLTDFSTKS